MAFRCIKTGCGLYDPSWGSWAWGDLYTDEAKTLYLFVVAPSMVNAGTQTIGYESVNETPWRPHIELHPNADTFERNGMVIVRRTEARPNAELKEFLSKWEGRR